MKDFLKGSTTNAKGLKIAMLALVAIGSLSSPGLQEAQAGFQRRQYYTSWTYRPRTRYYYSRYYHRPNVRTRSYNYHYVICYPSRPRYRYYYNPVRRVYWGRYEVDEKGKAIGYSMLKPEDRKSSLEEIPEKAFPKASKMPPVPESKDGEQMAAPPTLDFNKVPKDGTKLPANETEVLSAGGKST